jgi:sugar phosphate isomerase/epimerase
MNFPHPAMNPIPRLLRTSRIFFSIALSAVPSLAANPARDDSAAEKLGWHLATKAYTFRTLTLAETIDITQSLGLKYFELNPTQKLSKDNPAKTDHNLSAELRGEIKKKFAAAGIKLASYGVVPLKNDEAADRKIFDFAKDMGIETLVSEPTPDSFDLLEKLTQEYGIKIAIHNHPQPSPYWNPDTVLKAIDGHKLMGACADVGHWTRSDLNTVESLKKLEGRIITLHFKDVNDQKKDVPWGTGNSDVKGMLKELRRQNFKGVFSMEYESGGGQQLLDDMKKCIELFDKTAKELVGTE